MKLLQLMWPEVVLGIVAGALILLGVVRSRGARRLAPAIALVTLALLFALQLLPPSQASITQVGRIGEADTVRVYQFAYFIKLLVSGVGVLLVLLAWPTNDRATGNPALDFGEESGEFFGLMLLSIAGVFLVAGANDLILLFLGVELASIPTYIMVSISRPIPAAQEAGVKYFFLGALSAALMLFGFSYLYGTTGLLDIYQIAQSFRGGQLDNWQMLGVLMVFAGFCFKIAAVPLHFYVGDVYQGAATPLTAFLAFVPKASGMVALIKLLFLVGGNSWSTPATIAKLLGIIAVLTMTFGNVLALLQSNVKRMLAYSSVAHSGYMLVGLTVLVSVSSAEQASLQTLALQGVLFYLAAYGIMNTGAFAVLTLLPARFPQPGQTAIAPATSAETFEDLAGQGRRHLGLGLAMAVACFSLTGLPLTVGFWGKFFLIKPALLAAIRQPEIRTVMVLLAVLTVINAAISAGYYLRIVATLFLRPEATPLGGEIHPETAIPHPGRLLRPTPILLSLVLSVIGTLFLGTIVPATDLLSDRAIAATELEANPPAQVMLPGR